MSDNEDKYIPRYRIPDVGRIDAKKLYGGNNKKSNEPEFIENTGRDSMGHVFFTTGVCWLGGFFAGCAHGSLEGWNTARNPSFRIRFNSIMNGMSKYGSKYGNTLGAVAFLYSSNYYICEALELDRRIDHPAGVPALVGLTTGLFFKSTKGPRAALLAGVIGTTLSVGYFYGGTYFYNKVLGKGGRY